jgi:hypothetical protein
VVAADDAFFSLYERVQKQRRTIRLQDRLTKGCKNQRERGTMMIKIGLSSTLSLFSWHVGSLANHFGYFGHVYLEQQESNVRGL